MHLDLNTLNLQAKQLEHDHQCHQDIILLNTQDRIRHLTFHFAKYVGKLQENTTEKDSLTIYTDILICCLSSANILNINLNKEITYAYDPKNNFENFLINFSISCGRMAKACEALDHLESFPFRETLTKEVINISQIIIRKLLELNQNIPLLLEDRWENIKKKNFILTIQENSKKNSLSHYNNNKRKEI